MRPKFWGAVILVLATVSWTAVGCGGKSAPPATSSPIPTRSSFATPTPAVTPTPYQPPHNRPGPASDKLFFKAFDVDRAPLDFTAGSMDMYFFSLKAAAAQQLRTNPNVKLIDAPATSVSIILNPAPAPQGQINPFSIKAIRQAVQYLVNRNFVASDIYKGAALPMLTHLSPTDYDYLTIYDLVKGLDYRYDPEYARGIITREMTSAGALLVNGSWNYKGQPIRLKFIVRVEDERRDIGDLVSAELGKAGFLVAPSYQQFAPAVLSVYSSDPQTFEWNLYTEGWGRSGAEKYDFATINQMAAPWQGNMPGWREAGFWQYENADLDRLGQQLFTGNFKDSNERDQIYRQMTQTALDESVRVWVITAMNSFPIAANMRGVTTDLVGGPKGPWTLREANLTGKTDLTVGSLWVWTERTSWNPIGGLGDVYSTDIWTELHDPPIWNSPFTGLPIPVRTSYQVETSGPSGKLDVPSDAVMWDPTGDKWAAVGAGVRATSKVTIDYSKYFTSKWHDGQPISMGDVMYSIAQSRDIAYDPDMAKIEFAISVTSRPYLDTFKGYRILDNNRLEVYLDYWHFDKDHIASYASPTGLSMPWEVLAAMDDLVFKQRTAAYSDTAAARFNVPWLSLVMQRDANLVARTLRDYNTRSFIPQGVFSVGGKSLVSADEAKARYQAALAWFDKYNILVISNGPFFLARYDPAAQFAELDAFRDPTYPYHPGDWFYGTPPQLQITNVSKGALSVGKAADVTVSVSGPGQLGVKYVLLDPASGKVLSTGVADKSPGGGMVVHLDQATMSKLQPGPYSLFVAAYSDQEATITERKVDLDVGK